MELADLRESYGRGGLREADLDPDPIRQFAAWFVRVQTAGLREPNAMTLATATPDGRPAARTVLLKSFDERGFVFYTNYEGRKGLELAANPQAALLFYWPELERQVRVEGAAERTTAAESDAYFRTRPRGSQLGAWASPQSEVVPGRDALDRRLQELEREYAGRDVPRPPHWGGFRIRPMVIEFWQGRPNRMHDRLVYRRVGQTGWRVERLAP
jgi:pyridoxamine 5'-phosphate oxidase